MSEKSPGFTRYALPLALACIALLAAYLFLPRDREISRVQFPDKTQEVVYLPPAHTGQRLKTILFDKDGFTMIRGTIYHVSGIIQDLTYRKDNTVASDVEYYARSAEPEDWNVRGAKRSEARFAADGTTYVLHKVYRTDGTLERSGEKLSSNYLTRYFYPDGKTIARERTFDAALRYKTERFFDSTGALTASIYSESGDATDLAITLYRPDGTMRATMRRHVINGESGAVFAADGKTTLVEYRRDYYNLQEIYRDENGQMIQDREGSRMSGLLTVRHYRQSDRIMHFRQRFALQRIYPSSGGPKTDEVKLRRVEYYDFVGKRACEIKLDSEGSIVVSVQCPESDGEYTVQLLENDGKTVKTVQRVSRKGGKVLSSSPGGGTVDIDPSWLVNARPFALPEWSDEGAPPLVYDYR